MTDQIRVLIVDDHPVVREGLVGLLETQDDISIIGRASNGREAIAAAMKAEPDLVLMDLQMPEVGGTEAIAEIKRRLPTCQILVLTTYDTDADILRAIEAGATGYLLKDAPREELFRAVREAANGTPALSPVVARRLLEHTRRPIFETLTAREIEVLERAARGNTNADIAADMALSEATVKSHLAHIYRKLGVHDRTAAVTTALDKGIIRLP